MGGDCKFTNNLSEKFAWGLRIPGLDHSVRCKYCNTVVKIARGLFALKQHEQSAMHKKNMPSTSSRTPNIAAALYTSCSKETGVLRATIYHCLKIIVDDASFRSSECFSRNRSLYKVMFPDSSFAAINCGKTKTGYIITRAIAPFVRDQVTDKITSCDRVGIHMDERGYYPKLFDEDGQIKVFEIQKSELLYSSSNPAVLKALNEANQSELDKIKQDWDRANEGVLNAALRRFSSYLSNDIVRLFYIFHIPLEQFTAKTIRNLVRMAGLLKVDTGTVHDDFAALRVVSDAKASLQVLHGKGALSDYPHIKVLFETAHLISPHNMNVESGFSTMKFAESSYRTNLGCETYDALRLCKSFFRREDFENFNIPSELLQLVKNASSKYKEECEVLKARNQRVESQATVFRDEFDIYKRRTPCELKRELKSVDSEIERTQALLEELHSKKSRLSSETASANFLADSQSSDVIAKMFKNWKKGWILYAS